MSQVCNDQGTVVEVSGNGRVRVIVARNEACGSCVARGACNTFGGTEKKVEMSLANTIDAKKGDTVSIVISEGALIGASAILYIIPATGLVAGAIIAHLLGAGSADPDLLVAAGAGSGLLVGFATSFAVGRFVSRKGAMVPALESIIKAADTEDAGSSIPD